MQSAVRGQIMQISAGEDLLLMADKDEQLGVLFIAGSPLREPVIQHGPFVMCTKQQISQAMRDYQLGNLCNKTCNYTLHKAGDSVHSERTVGGPRKCT